MRKRQEAKAGESTNAAQPGLQIYVDTLAALVPGEVLAAHAAILTSTTKTVRNPAGDNVTTITEPGTLKAAFWALVVLSVVFYLAGFQKRKWSLSAAVGVVIPPLAFVGWTMAQKSTAFDALSPGTSSATRETVVVVGALALGLLATAVSYTVNRAPEKK